MNGAFQLSIEIEQVVDEGFLPASQFHRKSPKNQKDPKGYEILIALGRFVKQAGRRTRLSLCHPSKNRRTQLPPIEAVRAGFDKARAICSNLRYLRCLR
jgi:hypothetical protein